jgi:hypothetical protein
LESKNYIKLFVKIDFLDDELMSDSSSDEITEKSLINNKNKRRKIDRFVKNSEHNELSETFDTLYSSKVKNEPNEIENTSLTNNSYNISEY